MAELSKSLVLKVGALVPWAIVAIIIALVSLGSSADLLDNQNTQLVIETVCTTFGELVLVIWPFARLERGEHNKDRNRWIILICIITFVVTVGPYAMFTGQNEEAPGTIVVLAIMSYLCYLANKYHALMRPGSPGWHVLLLFLALFFLPFGCFYLAKLTPPKPLSPV